MVQAATVRELTTLELILFQVLSLGLGLLGSLMLGRLSARESAVNSVRPLGRSAVNRIVSLLEALRDLTGQFDQQKEYLSSMATSGKVPVKVVEQSLTVLSQLVYVHIRTVGDAMEDWREIVPERIDALTAQAEEMDTHDRR